MRMIRIWGTIFLALFIACCAPCPLGGTLARNLCNLERATRRSKIQVCIRKFDARQSGLFQEPYVFERFVTQVAFQKDGTSRADLQVVINVLSEAGVQRFGQLVFALIPAIKNWK